MPANSRLTTDRPCDTTVPIRHTGLPGARVAAARDRAQRTDAKMVGELPKLDILEE
jgi:hypothetical protein